MLDHIGLRVADVAAAQALYDAALAPLGIAVVFSVSAEQAGGQAYVGYGSDGKPYFWIGGGGKPTAACTWRSRPPTARPSTPSTPPR